MDVIADDLDIMAVQFGHSLMESDLQQFGDSPDHSEVVSHEEESEITGLLKSEGVEYESLNAQDSNSLPHDTPELLDTTESSQFVCTDCGMMYTKQSSLSNHRLSKHAFVCGTCGSRFGVRSNYESHIQFGCGRTAPPTEQFECVVCHKFLQSKKTLNKHLKHHYGIGSYRCKICQKLFQQRTHLDAHMRTHDGQKPFACRLCGNSYSEKSSMTRHLRKIHNTNDTDLIENRILEAVSASQQVDANTNVETEGASDQENLLEDQELADDLYDDNIDQAAESSIGDGFVDDDKQTDNSQDKSEAFNLESEKNLTKSQDSNEVFNEHVECDDDISEKLPVDERDEPESIKDKVTESLSDSYDSDNFYDEDDESRGEPPPNIGKIISARIRKSQNELNWAFIAKQKEQKLGSNKDIGMNRDTANLKSEKTLERPVINKILQAPVSRDCHICGKVLSSPSALRKHITRHNDAANAYKCVLCKKSFLETSALQEHMLAHRFEKKIKCDFCKVMFTEKSTYRRHLRRFHDYTLEGAREYVHINCKEFGPDDFIALMNTWKPEETVDEGSKTSDTEENKTETGTSSSINNSTSVDSLLSEQPHSRKKLSFNEEEDTIDVIKDQQSGKSNFGFLPEPKVYDCHICGRLLGNGTSLRRHIKRHGDDFKCTVCKRVFLNTDLLHQHMSVHNQQYLICSICGKTVTERSRYRSHLRTVHGFTLEGAQAYADGLHETNKVFKTNAAESESYDNSNITVRETENGDNDFVSQVSLIENYDEEKGSDIGEASVSIDSLSSHSKLAERSADTPNSQMNFMFKSYECPVCGKQLGDASARSKHIRRHDGHVAFKCEVCSEVFPQMRLIESHVKTHTLRGAKCNVCLLYFADRSSARRHLIRIHGLSPNSNQIEDHMADCYGDDDLGGYDASQHYSVIDIKKNPNVKVRDCYNSVLSSAVYQRMYESVREKSELEIENSDKLPGDSSVDMTPDAKHLAISENLSMDLKDTVASDLKPEKSKEDIDTYINQNSSVTFSVVSKRKPEDQFATVDKKIKLETEAPHQPLKLVFQRKLKEIDSDNVESPKFSIKESLLNTEDGDTDIESVKSDDSDNTVELDYRDGSSNNITSHSVISEVNGYSKENLESEVALLDEELRKRFLINPSLFLPANDKISSQPGDNTNRIVDSETFEELDASDNASLVKPKETAKHFCFDCKKYFSSYKSYRAHRRRFHPMTCDICNEKFLDLILYQSHIQGHLELTQAKRYDCPVCGKYIKDASSRAKHLRLHTGEKPYGCEICGKRFTQTGHLASHMRLHSGEKPYDCRLCGKYFSEKSSVKRHLRKIHFNQYNKKCNECGILCVTREDYKEHMLSHAKKVYSCDLCQKDFPDSKRLKLHNYNSHDKMKEDARTYACKECEKYFFSTKGLKNHVKRFHTNEVPVYNCALCTRTFLTTLTLESHMATHIKKDLICMACNKPFRTNGSLSLHKKRHIISFIQKSEKSADQGDKQTSHETEIKMEPLDDHENDTSENNRTFSAKPERRCNEIDRLIEDYVLTINSNSMYTNYCVYRPECILDSNLVKKYVDNTEGDTESQQENGEHKPDPKKIHANKTNPRSLNIYRCNSCGLFLTTKKHLMRHVIALHKQKSVKCPLCSSKFSTNILLRAHMRRIHDAGADSKLVCKFCNKELKDKRNLREHLKLHTGDLPYACMICSKAFSTHSKLTFHLEVHNKVQKQCPKCNTKFVHERSYRLHMQAQCVGRRRRAKIENQKRNAENYTMNYDCTICGRQYRYQESLYIHIKTNHGGVDVDFDVEAGNTNTIDQSIIDNAIQNFAENGLGSTEMDAEDAEGIEEINNTSQIWESKGEDDLNKSTCKVEKNLDLDLVKSEELDGDLPC